MNSPSPFRLRLYAITFATVLGAQATWFLAAELTRPSIVFFPTDQSEIENLTVYRDAAAIASRIGWPRGDLWVDYALTVDAEILSQIETAAPGAHGTSEVINLVTTHAATLAPYDARAWLLLAAINAKPGWKDDKILAQLKMSYYTSPNDIRLIPLRIQIATRSDSIADEELQNLVGHEIRTIVARAPILKPIIATAYRRASPAGRRLIEAKLAEFDPEFLTELRATKP